MLTSLQEGFGLPYLEAAAARRPLIARALPNIAPDLARFGFVFPQYYDEILINPELFDWPAEQKRQQRLFSAWRAQMPRGCRTLPALPGWLAEKQNPSSAPFSRLTLAAQLEILAQPLERSWELCAPLNPFLQVWRGLASCQALRAAAWPPTAKRWLSGKAYARRFMEIIATQPRRALPAKVSAATQDDFIRQKLRPEYLYPLLWNQQK